uniref:TSA: Wollemia nobilis Ref_Wollemi_Transcript_14734_2090 transcribed RNA sequence n=1 Tax=Wollemia nobilis TaxID=56998 RepID=A0A0C9RJE4_9CONI
MDFDAPSTPLFSVGQELAAFLASCGILSRGWGEVLNISNTGSFVLNEYEGIVYVTFPSHIEDFIVRDGRYGECRILDEKKAFSENLTGNDGQPPLVFKRALTRFQAILDNSDFKAQMQRLTSQRKEQAIIFAGHSIGGAVATLATIWLLEKRLRQISPFCITFGSPLVGDAGLGEAISREDWSGKFCHVVYKSDVFPRMLLAPFEATADPLNAILPHWGIIMNNAPVTVSQPNIQEACRTLLNNVWQCTSLIVKNYTEESCLRSPYRPFGTYMFCSSYGAACVEDSEAALKMLHFTMQSKEDKSFDEIAGACISDHTGYGNMLEHITEFLLNTRRIANPISDSPFEMGIALQLEAMGVGAENDHARLALNKAGEVQYEYDSNIAELNENLSKSQSYQAELEWYKGRCKDEGPGYYDCFKLQGDKRDFRANYLRKTLETFWNEIVEKVEKHELPSNFQSQNKWVNAGTTYRKLVEPLDIAHYYRTCKDGKSYLSPGVRPHRHIVLEKWFEEKEKTRRGRGRGRETKLGRTKFASLTEDSCFWARLEEACKETNLANAQFKESLEGFEAYVGNMIKNHSISAEIFLEQSSFMKWWQQYKDVQVQSPNWRVSSPLLQFMASESWKSRN